LKKEKKAKMNHPSNTEGKIESGEGGSNKKTLYKRQKSLEKTTVGGAI